MKIRFKLIASFVFLILLTAVLYGLAAYSAIREPMRSFEKRSTLEHSWLIVNQLNQFMDHACDEFSILSRQDLLNYIEDPEKSPLHHEEALPDILNKKFISNAAFLPREKTSPESLHKLEKEDLIPSDKDQELRIIPKKDPTRSLLRVSRKYYDTDGIFSGEGFIFLDIQRILNYLILKGPLKEACICIRDRSEGLLYSTLNKPIDSRDIRQVMAYTEEGFRNLAENKGDPFNTKEIYDEENRLFLIGSMLPALGLPIFIEPDFLKLDTIFSSMSQNMILIGAAILWGTVWIAMILGYRVMRPIEKLSLGAERIASGDYAYRLKPKGRDEIALLSQRFNIMAEAVEKRTHDLERTNEELKEQDRKKTNFLDTVAHDLRTPLTSIKAYADLLLRYPDESEKIKQEFLDTIIKESERMASLINDYLDLTKLENGTLHYRFREVNLAEMIHEFERINQGECKIREIRICSRISEPLPLIFADPDRLRQVFSNLLSNAIKYSPARGEIRIEVSSDKEQENDHGADWIEVSVSDEGPGIPDEFHEIIFDKFRQIENDIQFAKGGTGLGLPISREIIAKHGGKIWVEKPNGKGACFKFTLPVTPLENSETF